MNPFTFHTEESAPEASQPLLSQTKKALGFLPNLYAGMAEAPALLEGYQTLSGIFNKTNLSETERQIILMTNNRLNGCTYCMAAHTMISIGAKVPGEVIEALRAGTSIPDPKLEALRVFSQEMNESRGWVSEEKVQALLDAGYTKETVLEVILGTALKVMSNYTNHITETQVDDAFADHRWESQQ